MPAPIPDGFVRHARTSPLTAPWEPIWARRESDRLKLGLEVREPHTNSRGLLHGGLIASLADNAMGLSLGVRLEAEGAGPSAASSPPRLRSTTWGGRSSASGWRLTPPSRTRASATASPRPSSPPTAR